MFLLSENVSKIRLLTIGRTGDLLLPMRPHRRATVAGLSPAVVSGALLKHAARSLGCMERTVARRQTCRF